jgi:hypothetical protein
VGADSEMTNAGEVAGEGEGGVASDDEALQSTESQAAAVSDAARSKLGELSAARTPCSPSQFFDWQVKESFLAYLDSELAKGGWQADGVIEADSALRWPIANATLEPDESFIVAASGAIWFSGHDQQLSLVMANPTLTSEGLFLDFFGDSMTGTSTNSSQLHIADLASIERNETDAGVELIANLALTESGARAFGFYAVGTELAPVRLSLVPQADCVDLSAKAAEPNWFGSIWPIGILATLGLLAVAATVWRVRQRRNSE